MPSDREDNKRKMEAALLRNRRGRMCPEALGKLAASLGKIKQDLRVLDIDSTERLWGTCLSKRAAAKQGTIPVMQHRAWLETERKDFEEQLLALARRLPDAEVALLHPWSLDCEAVLSTSEDYLTKVFDVLEIIGSELVATSVDGSYGLWVDRDWQWFGCTSEGHDLLLSTAEEIQIANDVYEAEAYELLAWGDWLEGSASAGSFILRG